MNTPDQPAQPLQPNQPARRRIWRRRKGVALILVVSFIVLLSALVVGFFSRVTTELAGSRSYAESISARQLAESAVSMVMGQIRAATTITNGCWASQPGMIRVYGASSGNAGAQAYRFYKLYSSHNMVLTSFASFNPNAATFTDPNSGANAEVPIGPGGWQYQPAFFTDLNAYVEIPDPASTSNPPLKRYPIFDPSVATVNGVKPAKNNVEGCSVTLTDAQTLALNTAPMPVRWIYVLRDGTLTAPTPLTGGASGTSGLQAKWTGAGTPASPSTGVPSKDNPIVGRIAFWTDDETCKVNINTAGGYIADEPANPNYSKANKDYPESNPAFIAGSFWDTPRVQTYFDRGVSGYPVSYGKSPSFRGGLASSQPVRNEFQRYPGHPATTSLGLVLKGLLPKDSGLTSESLYDLTPRLMSGVWQAGEKIPTGAVAKNSQGGSQQLVAYDQQIDRETQALDADPAAPIKKTFDPTAKASTASNATTWSWHLLSSVDELYYTTLNWPTNPNSNGTRTTTNDQSKGFATVPKLNKAIDKDVIDKARFFLTAHSRSPELNLFGRPRVSIWPVPTPASEGGLLTTQDVTTGKVGIRNPSDDLLRYCSTVGADPSDPNRQGQFIFDREDPYSPTADFARARNVKIFNYLHEVTGNTKGKIPGWGNSFEAKYSGATGGRDQILTEIFDYIRSVNLKDTSRDERIDMSQGRSNTTQPAVPSAEALKQFARYAPRGVVVPTRTNVNGAQVSGFGRFPTISEISLVLYHAGYIYKPRGGSSTQEDVEYNFNRVNESKYNTDANTKKWFDNNDITGQLIRAFLLVETFNPMQGYGPVTQFNTGKKERIVYEIKSITGFNIQSNITGEKAQPLSIGTGKNNVYYTSGDTWGGRNFGGTEGFFHTMQNKCSNIPPTNPSATTFPLTSSAPLYQAYGGPDANGGRTNVQQANSPGNSEYYPFQSPCKNKMDGIRLPYLGTSASLNTPPTAPAAQTLTFSGGTVTMEISYVDSKHTSNPIVQKFEFTFPQGSNWPAPITEKERQAPGEGFRQDPGGFDRAAVIQNPRSYGPTQGGTWFDYNKYGGDRTPYYLPLRILWAQQGSYDPMTKFDKSGNQIGDGLYYTNRLLQILQPGDTIRSLLPGGTTPESTDPRTTHLQQTVKNFEAHPDYNNNNQNVNLNRRAQTLRGGSGFFYFDPTNATWFPGQSAQAATGSLVALGNARYIPNNAPDLPKNLTPRQKGNNLPADFDTGIGNFPDGAFCGKSDEGNVARSYRDSWLDLNGKRVYGEWKFVEPYFTTWVYDSPGDTYFSPNRQVPSPVVFGSLLAPTTDLNKAGWKTLLFCPNPAAGAKSPLTPYNSGTDHPGFANPPDHLLLDLFNMPVVEPYAISEPFSTDGKVNLNYQLMPFGYIERSTALRAALQALRVTAIPTNFTRQTAGTTELRYKGVDNDQNLRYLVDRDETLKGFAAFFKNYTPGQNGMGFFKSASQICEMFLIPKGQTFSFGTVAQSTVQAWWASCTLTGDNVREKPYSDLYSRVTTKSNTYTVHYRVQSLRQQPYTGSPTGGAAATYYQTWDESRDKVLSEYRGHTTIERYLDPRDPRFYGTGATAIDPDKDSLETAYRFRVIYNKRFSPW
jgi:uncharacterized protein (TIGR02600 family)